MLGGLTRSVSLYYFDRTDMESRRACNWRPRIRALAVMKLVVIVGVPIRASTHDGVAR
jgi:hypothetical protein